MTVEKVMRFFAEQLGYGDEADYWAMVGLLHDIDFELYPEEHCKKAPELLREAGVGEDMIYSICSHGYGICSEEEPVHEMEKVLFAAGCSREVIERGADQLGWELDKLLEMTLQAMAATEDTINEEMAAEQ